MKTTTILFTGYAPVHFVCFQRLFSRLRALPNVEVFVSGGLRDEKIDGNWHYDTLGMYERFALPEGCVLSMEAIAERDFDFLFAGNTKLIRPRNVGTTVQIFHGLSFRNKAVRSEQLTTDHFMLVGPYMKRKFAAAGLLAADDPRALSIGFPKTDPLLDGSVAKRDVEKQLGFSGARPIVLYAPTGQRDNSLELVGEDLIRAIAGSGRYDLVVKPHDHAKNAIDWFSRLAPLEGEHVRITREPDVVRLLVAADILISDASSVASEFSLTGRPVVFVDVPELIARAQADEESQVDLDTWGRKGGTVIQGPSDVVAALDAAVARPDERRTFREAMANDLFFNPGRATDAALDWITRKIDA